MTAKQMEAAVVNSHIGSGLVKLASGLDLETVAERVRSGGRNPSGISPSPVTQSAPIKGVPAPTTT